VSNKQFSRRNFLAAAGAAGLGARWVFGAPGQAKPKPVRIGIIGVGGRGSYHLRLVLAAGLEVPAVCDIVPSRTQRAIATVAKARGTKPEGYSNGPKDYTRMLARDDLDAVIVATPMQDHAYMCVDAMRAGKHVLCEVCATVTVDECWDIVRAAEETGKIYMLAENYAYWYHCMTILNMVQKGVFGDLTYGECGYVHDCRGIYFKGDGSLTWRGELMRDFVGNWYTTHPVGPVCQWMGVNRGDCLTTLVSMNTRQAGIEHYAKKRFPEGHPGRNVRFKAGDSINTLIRTANGAMIDLRFDAASARPHPTTCYFGLQGLKASYESRTQQIWIDGRSKGYRWEALNHYAKEFEHPKWQSLRERSKGGNGDAPFVLQEFLEAIRTGGPAPVDVYDAAAWSAIIPLSAKSVTEGSRPQAIPDFTRGKWRTRKG